MDCFQNCALRTRTEGTIIKVWAKLSELSMEGTHHQKITAAIKDAWACHKDPETTVSNAIDLFKQLTLASDAIGNDKRHR